ncbi:MAG: alpha/beta hydrolase [Devosiaceae bacterium]|nr:alpha/beta hydrolase [Devosiaceae bacterium]
MADQPTGFSEKMKYLNIGTAKNLRNIAIEESAGDIPGLFWLGGFKSTMEGTKAKALVAIGDELGVGVIRFDYSGHGASSGDFIEGTISDWLEEALAAFEQTSGEQIIIGSSMGAWLALLLNQKLKRQNRIKSLVLIAPAVDMTHDLMVSDFSDAELKSLEENGFVERPSDYDEPYILTKKLLDDGATHSLFGTPIQTGCPVHIMHGGKDTAVPTSHALKLVSHILLDPVFFTLIPDGDHSLSRPQDLLLLKSTLSRIISDAG